MAVGLAITDSQRKEAALIGQTLVDGHIDELWTQARIAFESKTARPKEGSKERDVYDDFVRSSASVDDCLKACIAVQEKADDRYTVREVKVKGHTVLSKNCVKNTLANINMLVQMGDVAVRAAATSETVGLAWSVVKLVLLAVQADAEQCAMWAQAAEVITGILVTCRSLAKLYSLRRPTEVVQRLLVTIPTTYETILSFAYGAHVLLARSGVHRLLTQSIPWSSAAAAANKSAFEAIKTAHRQMNDEALVAFQEKTDETLSDIQQSQSAQSADVAAIRRQLLAASEEFQSYHNLQTQRDAQSADLAAAIFDKMDKLHMLTPFQADRARFEERKKIFDPRGASDDVYRTKLDHRDPKDTCSWIFELDEYRAWFYSHLNRLLWLHGGPGLGKSVLLSVVIETLCNDDENPIVPFFFCVGSDAESSTVLRIKREIVYCLYEATAAKPEWLAASNDVFSTSKKRKGDKDERALTLASFNLDSAFESLAEILNTQIFIVIDALDECRDRLDEAFVATLQRWLDNPNIRVKILVSSRDEADIRRDLAAHPKVDLEMHNRRDIELRAESGLRTISSLSPMERPVVMRTIVEKARNQFTYVNLAIEQFRRPFRRPIENALNSLSEGVHALYQESLRRMDPAYTELAQMAIKWTLLRKGDLSVTVLLEAYSQHYTALMADDEGEGAEPDQPIADETAAADIPDSGPTDEACSPTVSHADGSSDVLPTDGSGDGTDDDLTQEATTLDTQNLAPPDGTSETDQYYPPITPVEPPAEILEDEQTEADRTAAFYRAQVRAAAETFVRIDNDLLHEKHQSIRECFLDDLDALASTPASTPPSEAFCKNCQRLHCVPFKVDEELDNLEIAITLLRHLNSPQFQKLHITFLDEPEPETIPEQPREEEADPQTTTEAVDEFLQTPNGDDLALVNHDDALDDVARSPRLEPVAPPKVPASGDRRNTSDEAPVELMLASNGTDDVNDINGAHDAEKVTQAHDAEAVYQAYEVEDNNSTNVAEDINGTNDFSDQDEMDIVNKVNGARDIADADGTDDTKCVDENDNVSNDHEAEDNEDDWTDISDEDEDDDNDRKIEQDDAKAELVNGAIEQDNGTAEQVNGTAQQDDGTVEQANAGAGAAWIVPEYDEYDSDDDLEMLAWLESRKNEAVPAPDEPSESLRYEVLYWPQHVKAAEVAAQRKGSSMDTPLWRELWVELKKFYDNEPLFRAWIAAVVFRNAKEERIEYTTCRMTPLHAAANDELCWATSKVIEDRGPAAASVLTTMGDPPLSFLLFNGAPEDSVRMLDLLLLNGTHPNFFAVGTQTTQLPLFCLLSRDPSLECLQRLADGGADFLARGLNGESALHTICDVGSHPEIIPWLIERGVDVNARDKLEATPLHTLLLQQSVDYDMLAALLDHGADINVEDNTSEMPLVNAIRYSERRAAEILIERGADLTDLDIDGDSVLYWAVQNELTDVIELLIRKGAPRHLPGKSQRTPLQQACSLLSDTVALVLLPHLQHLPADELDCASDSGKTPLWKASAHGFLAVVKKLLDMPGMHARLELVDHHRERSPLQVAAWKGRTDVVQFLLASGADSGRTDREGKTALCIAHEAWILGYDSDFEGTVMLLIDADPAAAVDDAHLLVAAAYQGSMAVVERLMALGARTDVRDSHDWTPLLAAKQGGRTAVVELLEQRTVAGQAPTKMYKPPGPVVAADGDELLDFTYVGSDGTDITHALLVADHPIPPGRRNFYFEVEVVADSHTPRPELVLCIVVGFATLARKRINWMPGIAEGGIRSWGWHSDDGYIRTSEGSDMHLAYSFGPGDTVGCGFTLDGRRLFWTINGSTVMCEVDEQQRCFDYTDVLGRLFPVVSFNTPVSVRVNLGGDTLTRPFLWTQANDDYKAETGASEDAEEGDAEDKPSLGRQSSSSSGKFTARLPARSREWVL